MFKITKSYDSVHRVFQGTITLLKLLHFSIMAGLLGGIHFEVGIGILNNELTIGLHKWNKQ